MNWEALLSGLTLLFYAVSSIQYHTHLFAGSERAARLARATALVGLVAHTAALGVWCMTHNWSILRDERMPFSVVAYCVVLVQLIVSSRKGWPALGSLSIPLAFIAESYAVTPGPSGVAAAAGSALLRPHVLALLLGFAAFALAFCLAVLYLLQSRLLKTKQIKGLFSRLPPLESVNTAAHRVAILGFTLLTLGIITGSLVAPNSWGPQWYLDPHTVTGLVAWAIYAAYLGVCSLLGWRGRRTTYFLIAGFLVVLIAFVASVNRPKPVKAADNLPQSSVVGTATSPPDAHATVGR